MRFAKLKQKYEGKIVDIHCHVLPDIDDGAVNFDQSINMLKISSNEGIVVVIATPHLVCDGSEKLYTARILKAYEALKALVEENGLPIRVKLGYELLLSRSLLHMNNIKNYVIEGTNRVLVEPHLTEPPDELDELIYELKHYNIGLILAHPERNEWLARNTAYLHDIVECGALLQVNAGSIAGLWGKEVERAAHRLAGERLIHLIGSDAHSDTTRSPCIREALAVLSRWIGYSEVETIAYKQAEQLFLHDTMEAGAKDGMPEM